MVAWQMNEGRLHRYDYEKSRWVKTIYGIDVFKAMLKSITGK